MGLENRHFQMFDFKLTGQATRAELEPDIQCRACTYTIIQTVQKPWVDNAAYDNV